MKTKTTIITVTTPDSFKVFPGSRKDEALAHFIAILSRMKSEAEREVVCSLKQANNFPSLREAMARGKKLDEDEYAEMKCRQKEHFERIAAREREICVNLVRAIEEAYSGKNQVFNLDLGLCAAFPAGDYSFEEREVK